MLVILGDTVLVGVGRRQPMWEELCHYREDNECHCGKRGCVSVRGGCVKVRRGVCVNVRGEKRVLVCEPMSVLIRIERVGMTVLMY